MIDSAIIKDLEASYGKMELTRHEYIEGTGLVYALTGENYSIRFFDTDNERQRTIKSISGLKEMLGRSYDIVEQGRHKEYFYYVAKA